jgi:hypothetical protein
LLADTAYFGHSQRPRRRFVRDARADATAAPDIWLNRAPTWTPADLTDAALSPPAGNRSSRNSMPA